MNVPTWVWWLAGIFGTSAAVVVVVFLAAVRLGAILDDMQEIIRQDERERAALGRAAGHNVVPIRRHTA